jgi:hypothetical protein
MSLTTLRMGYYSLHLYKSNWTRKRTDLEITLHDYLMLMMGLFKYTKNNTWVSKKKFDE